MYKEYLLKVLLKGMRGCETQRDQGNVADILTVLIKEDRWSKKWGVSITPLTLFLFCCLLLKFCLFLVLFCLNVRSYL